MAIGFPDHTISPCHLDAVAFTLTFPNKCNTLSPLTGFKEHP